METKHGKIIYIEYRGIKPFNVTTFKDGSADDWDFDYSKKTNCIYYHCSGCGPLIPINMNGFVEIPSPLVKLWISPEVILHHENKPINKEKLLELGYQLIDKPLDLAELMQTKKSTTNPFDVGFEDEPAYCEVCDDWLPDDYFCEHLLKEYGENDE